VIKGKIKKGNKRARLALDVFLHRIKRYLGAYLLLLGGADAIIFTAGIGEHYKGVINRLKADIRKTVSTKTKILIIPTDEEQMIAELTYALIGGRA